MMSGLSCSTRCTLGQVRRTCTYIWQEGWPSTGKLLLTCKVMLIEPISHSYKKFKVEVEKVVGEVQIGDGHKVSTATAVISGLVGSQRTAQSPRKKLEGDNSPVPTRSKSLRLRGDSSNCQGVAQGNKGKRRSFAVMHNSLDSSI